MFAAMFFTLREIFAGRNACNKYVGVLCYFWSRMSSTGVVQLVLELTEDTRLPKQVVVASFSLKYREKKRKHKLCLRVSLPCKQKMLRSYALLNVCGYTLHAKENICRPKRVQQVCWCLMLFLVKNEQHRGGRDSP